MTNDLLLREALDLYVPPSDEVAEWEDVLRRASLRPARRRLAFHRPSFAAGLALAIFILAVGVALAYGLKLFPGQPAPPAVKRQVRASIGLVKNEFVQSYKGTGVIASKTTVGAVLQASTGPVYLWVAPTRSGGYCTLVQIVGSDENSGRGFLGSCLPRVRALDVAVISTRVHARAVTVLYGEVRATVAKLELRYPGGGSRVVPLSGRFFLAEVPAPTKDVSFIARDRRGTTIGKATRNLNRAPQNTVRSRTQQGKVLVRIAAHGTRKPITLVSRQEPSGANCLSLLTPAGSSVPCLQPKTGVLEITARAATVGRAPNGMLLIWGRVGSGIRSLRLEFADGSTTRLQLSGRYFLYQVVPRNVRPGHQPVALLGLDARGRVVTRHRLGT